MAVTPEGTELRMGPDEIGADKLAYPYSVTAHRSQGQTVDATYALAGGGGRELAYVAMSRARGESHVHVVATDLRQASQRLAWAWGQERRQAWALDRRPGNSLANSTRSVASWPGRSLRTARPSWLKRGNAGRWPNKINETYTRGRDVGPARRWA